MAQELINGVTTESIANPETVEISDVRNYIYEEAEYDGLIEGTNPEFELSISMIGDCNIPTIIIIMGLINIFMEEGIEQVLSFPMVSIRLY